MVCKAIKAACAVLSVLSALSVAVAGGAAAGCAGLFCTDLGAAPRMQFQVGSDGYCGEMSMQVAMLKHGVWLPQEYVRVASTGSRAGAVLVETRSYKNIMRRLHVEAEQYAGGDDYAEYMAFVKQGLVRGHVGIIVYQFEGSKYGDYGHIVPVTGITTATPSGGYDPDDTLSVHTHFTRTLARRRVGGYRCPARAAAWPPLEDGGCVPRRGLDDGWAWVVKGPRYLGIGPRVELVGVPDQPRPYAHVLLPATVVVHGLTPGARYALYRVSQVAQVPPTKTSPVRVKAWKLFVATKSRARFRTKVWSDRPRWFIATPA